MGQVIGQAETSTIDPKSEDFCGFKSARASCQGEFLFTFLWQYAVTVPLPTLGGNNGVAQPDQQYGRDSGRRGE